MSVGMAIEALLQRAYEDLMDGNHNTENAQRAISEARSKNFALFAVNSKLALRDLEEAEQLAQRAAQSGIRSD